MLQVHPSKVYFLIGSGGKKVKSIIEESGVEAIDMQDDGTVRYIEVFSFFLTFLCMYGVSSS